MSRVEWIVCERTGRWASALRLALAATRPRDRLRETRHFAELDAEIATRPTALAAIEVRRDNFAQALDWLAMAGQRHIGVHCVALVENSLSDQLADVGEALAEAGARAIVTSPRRLGAILALAARHAEVAAETQPVDDRPLEARVWASLPWQAG